MSVVNVITAVAVIVFGIIAITKVHNDDSTVAPDAPALTLNERTAHAGTMIGIGLLTGIFALLSIFFGWQGISKVHIEEKRTKAIKKRRQAAAYSNPEFIDTY